MAEFRKLPTQAELQQMLFMESMRVKTPQEIAQENLAKGTTIKPIPENVFQKIAGGARTAGEFVNRAGTAADVAKLFPGYTGQSTVNIPTSFNFAPKQAPTGEIIPGGLQTQPVQVNQLLKAIKPADVLGISGAERAYTDVGLGKAPQPLDVLDVAGLGAIGYGTGKTALKATKGVPVGLSIQETKGLLQTAPKSDIGFYSAVEQAALATPRKSGTGQAFLNDISKGQDVRADEIKWMGLDDFLKGKQNVTRQEVQDYIANNRVDVQEVKSTIPRLPGEEMPGDEGAFLPKFGQYTLPGGENYRELLLTMPQKTAPFDPSKVQIYRNRTSQTQGTYTIKYGDNVAGPFVDEINVANDYAGMSDDAIRGVAKLLYNQGNELSGIKPMSGGYKSPHFSEPNILAHLRVNDRIDADGKKMLLIEEVQSDWHQAGRDKGYKGQLTSLPDDYFVSEMQNKAGDTVYEIRKTSNPNVIINRDYNRQSAINGAINTLNETVMGVPDAPFKDTWYQLALKRAIQHAAENGYDRIGLTTGARQAERFDLSKQIDRIELFPNEFPNKGERPYYFVAYDKDGRRVMDDTVTPEKLGEYIGKDASKKLLSIEPNKQGERYLEGADLQVGGEGMKKYYDEIYPKFLDKYGKKWGARVGETSVDISGGKPTQYGDFATYMANKDAGKEPVRYIDITPEMKAGVSKGQPLFMAAPIGAGLLGSESMTPER